MDAAETAAAAATTTANHSSSRRTLLQYLEEKANLSREMVEDLLRFGAIWYSPIPPLPKTQLLDEETQELILRIRSEKLKLMTRGQIADFSKRKRALRLNISHIDMAIEWGSFIRVHCHPIRFDAVYTVDWPKRIIAESEHYVVLNKPEGVPVPATVDNLVETCLAQTATAIGAYIQGGGE
eukprot:jgi/Bigna1/66160/fgenesh1_pg.1_\